MKKLLIGIFAICALCGLESRQPNTVNVDSNGVVSKGASKLSSKNYDLNSSAFNCRKPTRAETCEPDPRQWKDHSNTWFK